MENFLAHPFALEPTLRAIHATPHQGVLAFAGAGAGALAWLHHVPGSSRTLLEATDHYAEASLVEAIGFRPARLTAPEVAQALSIGAYRRALVLRSTDTPAFGLGSTATIATDRQKRGEHRCAVALCDPLGVSTTTLTLRKGARSRAEEEALVSGLIICAVAHGCGLDAPTPRLQQGEALTTQLEPVAEFARFLDEDEDVGLLEVYPDGVLVAADTRPNSVLFSGSFNPLHDGHRALAALVAKQLNHSVTFELPLANAEKATITADEVRRRVAQFAGYAPIALTCVSHFHRKTELFPHSTFVIGADTAARLVAPRFYHDSDDEMARALEAVRGAGCRFLVAGRQRDGRFLTLEQLAIPSVYRDLFEAIPEESFRMDISSSLLRKGDL